MFLSLRQCYRTSMRVLLVCLAIVSCYSAAMSQAQSNAADLQGVVRDPKGAVVPGASVTVRNTATNSSRDAMTDDDGFYKIVNLSPGEYEVTVKAQGYKNAVVTSVKITVGQTANQDVPLEVGDVTATVNVTSVSPNMVETTATSVNATVDQQRIENLPINERNYLSFALTTSTVSRDNGRPIGPAPTTGLNFGGQRGRSNLVQVDGADNTIELPIGSVVRDKATGDLVADLAHENDHIAGRFEKLRRDVRFLIDQPHHGHRRCRIDHAGRALII